jgi:hypothetical protein
LGGGMNRTPPEEVRRKLRKEVGFGCPVCGNPYLQWCHFDPPWHVKQHHNPDGMIALCAEHHAKADAGAYTKEQLRALKETPTRSQTVKGKFEWMRRDILAIVGGNFYYQTPVILQIRDNPIIWFNRDEESYLLVNILMLTTSGEPRMVIKDNFWLTLGNPTDLKCPPSGKLLSVSYPNGDSLKVEFFDIQNQSDLTKRYPRTAPQQWGIPFPVTGVEIHNNVVGTKLNFGPKSTIAGILHLQDNFFKGCKVAIHLN